MTCNLTDYKRTKERKMTKEYTVYKLNENDHLPFGTHAKDGIEFPSMEIDGM